MVLSLQSRQSLVTRTFDRGNLIRCCTYDPKGAYIGRYNLFILLLNDHSHLNGRIILIFEVHILKWVLIVLDIELNCLKKKKSIQMCFSSYTLRIRFIGKHDYSNILCLKYNCSCSYSVSAVGFVNGSVRVLDSITLQDELPEPFRYARDAITHIAFSHNSEYLATAVSLIYLFL